MVPKKSTFQFDDFLIVKSICTFIPPKSESEIINPKEFTDKYSIDIDFTFRKEKDTIVMFCKISINEIDEPLPGYSIFLEGFGVFDQSIGADLKGQDHIARIQVPALSSGVNQFRSAILLLTSLGPFGKYQLPMFNSVDIFNQKARQLQKKKAISQAAKKKEA